MAFSAGDIDKRIAKLRAAKEEIAALLTRGGHAHLLRQREACAPQREFALKRKQLKELRVACVMDRFTLDSYAPECILKEVTPDGWKKEIASFSPDLLFIESAWQGKDGLWHRKIAGCSKEYFEMTSYCQEHGIPIVFWNKEDPIYTDTFMAAARMADVVFTTDIDCIEQYKTELGHDRVYHLHFAAQPKVHNPIEKYERKDRFCFAGAYYHRYAERSRIFDSFAEVFIKTKGFDIYDRNYKSALPEHAFPRRYDPYILGKLDPSEIDVAYKGYAYGINMNSVNQSQTMFARRVFELMASNTITVGNYSRGVKNYFGDLTICTDDQTTLEKVLARYCADEETRRKYRLLGLRKVLSGHLYEDRLAYVVQKVFGASLGWRSPSVLGLCRAPDAKAARRMAGLFAAQTYQNCRMLLICDEPLQLDDARISVVSQAAAQEMRLAGEAAGGFVAVFSPEDYYGTQYLTDLMLTLRCGDWQGVGKAAYYQDAGAGPACHAREKAYLPAEKLSAARAVLRAELFGEVSVFDAARDGEYEAERFFAADEFHYCKGSQDAAGACAAVEDLFVPDQGIALSKIEAAAEKITAAEQESGALVLDAAEIARLSALPADGTVKLRQDGRSARIESSLAEGRHVYFYLNALYPVAEYVREGKLPVLFSGAGGLDVICVCLFYNEKKEKAGDPVYPKLNQRTALDLPRGAAFIKCGFRIKGSGISAVKQIILGGDGKLDQKSCYLARSNVLILTNQYPSPQALYRNMFVHKRVTSYLEQGCVVDVMRMNIYAKDGFMEFDGINVTEGQSSMLAAILEHGGIDTVCVHFLDRQMWEVLKNYSAKVKINVWLHGAEIQPWWRREYNYNTPAELERAKKDSDVRQAFWAEVFREAQMHRLHFVFVSQYFANEIFEDNHIMLDQSQYSIIHNFIDTEMFSYQEKPEQQRKMLLSIRPYASNKYANDLTVKCILELAKKPFFGDLSFLLIGSGELFDSTVAPIKKFKNVTLRKTFLRQDEIAKLHKDYGVFLTPTRMDAQGVSRDEAMSSGMVPVTNGVTAIPEFVDETCGILAPGEDYMAMAEGIERLYNDPALFSALSKGAAERVRGQSSLNYTIGEELRLICG